MAEAEIRVAGRRDPIRMMFDGPLKTFELETDRIRASSLRELDPLCIDLLEIAATAFAADSAERRGGPTRPGMGADWRRSFDFQIPVSDPTFWNRTEVRHALEDAIGFLTEDTVTFRFIRKQIARAAEPFLDLDPHGTSFDAEEVILFSGGLDSFAGALESLSTSNKKVILLTHRSAQKAIPRQVKLGRYLAERFPDRVLHIHVKARRVGQVASDSSQRSRSFLFAALGQLVARAFRAKRLSFYENGVISHNLPISAQVVGTMATRTTHPLSLRKLNTVMEHLGPDHIPIENRYRWLTKRDVVERIAQHNGADRIPISVSCTSIREQTTLHTHCGTCSQCIDRRFALLAAGLGKHDSATDYGTDILFGSREKPQSQTMAVEWTRHALNLSNIDHNGFIQKFGTEFARISEGHPDQSKQAVLDQCVGMHKRHGESVLQVLKQVLSDHATAILLSEFPPTSLVTLILGQQGVGLSSLVSRPSPTASRIPQTYPEDEIDLISGPEDPLRVSFAMENGRPMVSIVGLCDLTMSQALVPTDLKSTFLEDLSRSLRPDDHRYIATGTLASAQNTDKSVIRQQVKRCRQTLGESFKMVHSQEIEPDRFIQNSAHKGYRLAPSIIPIRLDES